MAARPVITMAADPKPVTPGVRAAGVELLRVLQANPEGLSLTEIQRRVAAAGIQNCSRPTLHRAIKWLQDEADAPIVYGRRPNSWSLADTKFALPLLDPGEEDLTAVMFAAAALHPIADEQLNARIDRLVEDLDGRVRTRHTSAGVRMHAVMASVTTATPTDPKILRTILKALGRSVLKISYESPWNPESNPTHTIEPWQLRLHDGAMYLRAHCREAGEPRSFRLTHIRSARILDGDTPGAPIPRRDAIWGGGDPAFGIDLDRPDTAVIQVHGAMARWLSHTRWHPHQRDDWITPGELLKRTLPYRSCRELARRLLSLGDALRSVQPTELRDEVQAHARALARLDGA